MKYSLKRMSNPVAFVVAFLFFAVQLCGGVGFAADNTKVDPAKQAAWETAQAEAAKRVTDFEAAVKAGKPERVRKAALNLQSDPMAVQKLNQANRPDLVEAHNQVTEKIKTGAKENIRENMAKEWNRTHPNDRPITKKDVEIYEPTNYKDASAKPKSGQDWDVTVRVKGKDVPPSQSQKVVEKSYYDAAGGEKTFGKRAPGVTTEQAAAAAAHKQAVEVTHGKSTEAYNEPETILGTKTEKPNAGKKLTDSEQLTHAIENKSNISRNKAADATAAGNSTEAVRQEAEQMRQASKQYDKISKPRVEAAGGEVSSHVEKGMDIVRDAGAGKISPEQARAELAKMGETPESVISKASGQAEAAQKLKPSGTSPEPTKSTVAEPELNAKGVTAEGPEAVKVKGSGVEPPSTASKALKAAGTVMVGVDIGSTAQDTKEDLKKGDYKGAATKVFEGVANTVTAGEYGAIKTGLEKNADMSEAQKQIANANKQNEAAYDLQAEKKLREAGVSRDEITRIMDAKEKGDDSALENKLKELGIKAPEKIVEKGPVGDDTAGERAVEVGKGMVESAGKAGTFVKETVQDVGEITTGMTEKGVAAEVARQAKENIGDAVGTYQENKKAGQTTEDFKQSVKDRLLAKGATPEGAQKAADALVDKSDSSKMKKLEDLLDKKNKEKDESAKKAENEATAKARHKKAKKKEAQKELPKPKEETKEAPVPKGNEKILEAVTPARVTAVAKFETDASFMEYKNIVTTTIVISFWNLGEYAAGYDRVNVQITDTASLNGVTEKHGGTGSFSGGPNGVFSFNIDGSAGQGRLINGATISLPEGKTAVVQNPEAFKDWPK